MRFTIILSNRAGELDRRTANTEQEVKEAIAALALEVAYFSHGDTITVLERDGEG